MSSGVNRYYLKPAEGIVQNAAIAGTGFVRGGFNWSGILYRVVGDQLVRIDSDDTATVLGSVGNDQRPVTIDYSFDRLSITSNSDLFYYSSTLGLIQVTDSDLGNVKDHKWVDGYFMCLDDQNNIVVTELSDPTSVDPLKYGSSEADPDDTIAVLKPRNEPHVLNRYTIEAYQNVGGTGFPFAPIEGAEVRKGVVGTHMCAEFMDNIAFVGSGRNESMAVYITSGGQTQKISTREVDLVLCDYQEATLANQLVEAREHLSQQMLYIHLPDKTLVYDAAATKELGTHIWYTLGTGLGTSNRYLGRHHVWCYDRWNVGHPAEPRMGYLSDTVGEHWTTENEWQFDTDVLYNEGNGAIIHELELVAMTGRTAVRENATISTQYSYDGQIWSQLKTINAGRSGERNKKLVWLGQGPMKDRRIQRFRGTSKSRISPQRLNARIEALTI